MFPLAFYECPGSGPEVAAVCRWQIMPGLFLAKCLGNLSLRGSGMEKQQQKKTKLVLSVFQRYSKLGEETRSDGAVRLLHGGCPSPPNHDCFMWFFSPR